MFFLLTSLVSFSFLISLTKKSSIGIFKEQAFLFFLVFLIYFNVCIFCCCCCCSQCLKKERLVKMELNFNWLALDLIGD